MLLTDSLHARSRCLSIVDRARAIPALVLLVLGCGTQDPPAAGGGATGSGGAHASGGRASSGGGSGGASGGGGSSVTVPPCVTAAFTSANLCGACHTPASAPLFGGLDLSGDVIPRILDKPATYGAVSDKTNCMPGALILDTANPENSVMLKKLNNTQDCGAMMPSGRSISETEKACLVDWIRSL